MEKKYIKLEPKQDKPSFNKRMKKLLANKGKRYLFTALFILPFVAAIVFFSFYAYKEAKNLISLFTGTSEINDEYIINSGDYLLRDNATDIQLEYFTELKNAIEVDDADDIDIAGLVVKNYVADFYTWSNKQGQYDVSALYYVYEPQKQTIYTQARDGFYKYLSTYIEEYGSENLLEVESVTINSNTRQNYVYTASDGETYSDVFLVSCVWSYKANDIFSTSKYPTRSNFLVVKRSGRLEIVEASESVINVEQESLED